uniref:DcrB-related protein n=1 Tax=Xenorhabdus eapokensis TaxID=1873482 RepID=UPI000A8BE018
MSTQPYQMNEGTLTLPDNWRDETIQVFVLPDDSGVNLVINRTPVPEGSDPATYYAQTLTQFATHLPGYQEHQRLQLVLS